MVTITQLRALRAQLEERNAALRDEVRQELLATDEEHYIDLAGQVHDLEEESVADLLVDLDLAVIDLHINEIREIEAALARMNTGAYGVCSDCNDELELARLRAFPIARRCVMCQEKYERTYAGARTPTL